MVTILVMSAKLTTSGFLKIKIFRKEGYGVIISDYDITKKILLRDSSYVMTHLKSKKKKLAQTSFCYVNREIWLGN